MINERALKDEFNKKLYDLIKNIEEKALNQFKYNLETNIGLNILKPEECPEHAIRRGLVSAISKYNHWEPDLAVQFAVEVLEDSNVHDLAKKLNELKGF